MLRVFMFNKIFCALAANIGSSSLEGLSSIAICSLHGCYVCVGHGNMIAVGYEEEEGFFRQRLILSTPR